MLLVIDVGNTNTVLGLYREKELVRDWRGTARHHRGEGGVQRTTIPSLAVVHPSAKQEPHVAGRGNCQGQACRRAGLECPATFPPGRIRFSTGEDSIIANRPQIRDKNR